MSDASYCHSESIILTPTYYALFRVELKVLEDKYMTIPVIVKKRGNPYAGMKGNTYIHQYPEDEGCQVQPFKQHVHSLWVLFNNRFPETKWTGK